MSNAPIFIVGAARSGTTAMSRICATAVNAVSLSEPPPTLGKLSRDYRDGRVENIDAELTQTLLPRIKTGSANDCTYIEKQVTLDPFVENLQRLFNARFIWLVRDGRDVVRSLVNWHDQRFGNIYRECRDAGSINPTALSEAGQIAGVVDESDFNRGRPKRGERWFEEWTSLSRAEMCAWYWNDLNKRLAASFDRLERSSVCKIDFSDPCASDIQHIFQTFGLREFEQQKVQQLLDSRINSNIDRGVITGKFPHWKDWDGGMRRSFRQLAGEAMALLGYFNNTPRDWMPDGFDGKWPKREFGDSTIFDRQISSSVGDFLNWFSAHNVKQSVESVAEFGTRMGGGLQDRSEKISFHEYEMHTEPKVQEAEIATSGHPRIFDFVSSRTPRPYDIVFSFGGGDHAYDIEAFISSMVYSANRSIYLTSYSGWRPDLNEHQYKYDSDAGIYFNTLSLERIKSQLKELGCVRVDVNRFYVGLPNRPFVVRIVADVQSRDRTD